MQEIAAAEQQAHGGVTSVAKREGDARGSAPAPVLLLLWNGIKMRMTRLEARVECVLWDECGAAIGRLHVLLLLEDRHHGDVEGARGVVANLNVGGEERHVAELLAERECAHG